MKRRSRNAGRCKARANIYRNDGTQVGVVTAFGKSIRKAGAAAKRIMAGYGIPAKRNVAQGFMDSGGVFHPIRASSDYSTARGGDTLGPKYKTGRAKRQFKFRSRPKPKKKARKKNLNFGQRMARIRKRKGARR